MLHFGSLCYLDVQKSGSTFLVSFLRKHCKLQEIYFERHAVINQDWHIEGDPLFFITSRNPVEQYESLYAYGCEFKGQIEKQLRGHEIHQTYDRTREGYERWLAFMLEPAGPVERFRVPHKASRLFGFMTFRFLRLSFYRPIIQMKRMDNRNDVVEVYHEKRLHKKVIPTETLNDSMIEYIDEVLGEYLRDPDAAKAELANTDRINESKLDKSSISLDPGSPLIKKIKEREWFFYEALNYDAASS